MSDNLEQNQGQGQADQQPFQQQDQQEYKAPGPQDLNQDPSQGRSAMQRGAQASGAILIPPVDVIEDAGGITLLADLPGVAREGLHLRLEANSLTIDGEVTLDLPEQMESRYAEVKHQHYQRSFSLSRDLDAEQAVAELNHGVLRLRIPKAQHAQPRKIEIKVA